MRKYFAAIAAFAAVASIIAVFAPESLAGAKTVCPAGGASNTTFNHGLEVTPGNYCLLVNVTVNGGLTVDSGGTIPAGTVDIEGATVNGGVTIRPGGEIEVDAASIFGGTPTFSKINGGINLNNARDWDIETAQISGGVTFNGGPDFLPTFCGNTVNGTVSMLNVSTSATLLGDPIDEGIDCSGNTILGSLLISNSSFLEAEANTVSGSVSLSSSTLEFNGNTIGGSLACSNGTIIVPGQPGDPSGNTVGGKNTC